MANWKMAIEIVSFPNKKCDFPVRYVELPEGNDGYIPANALHGYMKHGMGRR